MEARQIGRGQIVDLVIVNRTLRTSKGWWAVPTLLHLILPYKETHSIEGKMNAYQR